MNTPTKPGALQLSPFSVLLLSLFAGYAALCWWLFTPMMQALHQHWITTNDLDAGYLLLAVFLFVLWQVAPPVAGHAGLGDHPKTSISPLIRLASVVLFVLCIAAASVTTITANKSVTLALLVIAFAPLCVWVMGARTLSPAAHACAILLMATPIWFVLVPQLQALTATAVNWLLSRGSWPIYIEGNLIALPQGMLEIAAGCAGLKFLQTALALTLIEGFIARRNWRAMFMIGSIAVVLAIVSNWLRVSVITLLALELDPAHPWVADHNWVGWLIFAAIFGPLFYWLGSVEFFTRKTPADPPTMADEAVPLEHPAWGHQSLRAVGALVVGFGTAGFLSTAAEGEASARMGSAQVAAVERFCDTLSTQKAVGQFPGAQLVVDCVTAEGRHLALRGYLREQQEREVINPINELVPGVGLLDYYVTSQPGATAASAPARVQLATSGQGGEKTLEVAYGFYASGAWTAKTSHFKLRSLLRPFVPGPVYALILVETPRSPYSAVAKPGIEQEFRAVANALKMASPE